MKKLLLLVVLCSLTLLSGCNSETSKAPEKPPEKPPAKESAAPAKVKVDLIRSTEALAQFQKDVKEKFGPDFKVFRGVFGGTVHVYQGKITFQVVDPKNTKNVDEYTWVSGKGFENPKPVKVRTIGSSKAIEDFAEYQDSMTAADFTKIPAFIEEAEKKAKEQQLEGVKPITSLRVQNKKGKHLFNAGISSTRKDARAYGDAVTGKVTKFEIN